jgi:hypothetical protein
MFATFAQATSRTSPMAIISPAAIGRSSRSASGWMRTFATADTGRLSFVFG